MPKYLITPATPAICYITQADVMPAQKPWEGVTALYGGAGRPLDYSGPFTLPPAVQQSVLDFYGSYVPGAEPWVVEDTPDTASPAGSQT